MTLKQTIYNLLLNNPILRDSDRKLMWKVWKDKGLVDMSEYGEDGFMTSDDFMTATSPESVRRCRQSLQRSDKLTGKNLIQPTKKIEKFRLDQAKLKGYNFIQGQESFI